MTRAICSMNNCRKSAPADEPFCSEHRGKGSTETRRELLHMLTRFLVPEACLNGTRMVPLHQDTIREIVEALERLQALEPSIRNHDDG